MSTPESSRPEIKSKKAWAWPVPAASVVFIHVYLFVMYCGLVTAQMRKAPALFFNKTGMYYTDFVNIWSSARLTLAGRIMDLFDSLRLFHFQQNIFGPQFHYQAEWYYPLHFMPVVLGLGALNYPPALGLWLAATFACYAFAVAFRQPQPWILALVLLLAPASFENIGYGQNGFLMAAFLAGGLRALDRRPALAGALFGLLTFKPQLFVLAPVVLLAGRRWKALAFMVVTAAALAAFSAALFGLEPWLAYLHNTLPLQNKLLTMPAIHPGFNMKLGITPFLSARLMGAPLGVAAGVAAFFALVSVLAVAGAFRTPASSARRAAIVMTAALLATPYALAYDMTVPSAAVILFLAAPRAHLALPWREAALCLLVWILPLFVFTLNANLAPATPLVLTAFLVMQLRALAKEADLRPEAAQTRNAENRDRPGCR